MQCHQSARYHSFGPTPKTAREIADITVADKPQMSRKQAIDLQQAVYAALRKRDGGTVAGEGSPARWKLSTAP